jgi:hypothetical protein
MIELFDNLWAKYMELWDIVGEFQKHTWLEFIKERPFLYVLVVFVLMCLFGASKEGCDCRPTYGPKHHSSRCYRSSYWDSWGPGVVFFWGFLGVIGLFLPVMLTMGISIGSVVLLGVAISNWRDLSEPVVEYVQDKVFPVVKRVFTS